MFSFDVAKLRPLENVTKKICNKGKLDYICTTLKNKQQQQTRFNMEKENISTLIEPKAGELDATDIKILTCLQDNSRLTTKELAAKVHLSTTPVFERQKRLEREGYIKKYIAVLDPEKLNLGFVVFCCVRLRMMTGDAAHRFEEAARNMKEVAECYNISGEFDYLLKVYCPDMRSYKEFLMNVLGTTDTVGSIQSMFVMSPIKKTFGLSI